MADPAHRRFRMHPLTGVTLALLAGLALACGGDEGGGDGPAPVSGAVRFEEQPGPATAFTAIQRGGAAAPVTVEIVDDEGNLIADATDEVTISLEAAPGTLLLHASGIDDPNTEDTDGRLIELVDVGAGRVRYILEENWRLNAPTSFAYDAPNDRYLLANRATDDFYRGDPRSGAATLIGDGTAETIAGMAFEVGGEGRLFAVRNKNFSSTETDSLFTLEPSTGETTEVGTLTPVPDERNILYFTGLAMVVDPIDPSAGTLYGTAGMSGAPGLPPLTGHVLVEIDPETLTATVIGDTGQKVAGLAAHPDGTLYAITGNKSATPETLMTVDTVTGALAPVLSLPNGADGEAIVFVAPRIYGTVTQRAVNGVASFEDLKVDATGTDYTLRASAPQRASGTSAPFTIDAPTPAGSVEFDTAARTVLEDDGTGAAQTEVVVTVVLDAPLPHDLFITAATGGTASDSNEDDPDTDLDHLDYVRFFIPGGQGLTTATSSFTVFDDDIDELVETDPEVFEEETVVFHLIDASLALGIGAVDTLTITIDDPEDVTPPPAP